MRRRDFLVGALTSSAMAEARATVEPGRVATGVTCSLPRRRLPRRSTRRLRTGCSSASVPPATSPVRSSRGRRWIFLSSDEGFVLRLADAGLTRDRGTLYALGRIALISPAGSTLPLDERLEGLRAHWSQVHRFAIADPEHAPYGRPRARRFSGWGLLDEMRERMVLGENVPQATQYVASGSAQAGITALSLARSNAAPALARSCWRW